jgi:hypothetical protein
MPEWSQLFGDSAYEYPFINDNDLADAIDLRLHLPMQIALPMQ